MDKVRAAFHKEYPDAAKYFHTPTGKYTWMRFNDMYDAWSKATTAAKPVAEIGTCKTHGGSVWVNFAQHPMLRMEESTELKAQERAIAEGFRLPEHPGSPKAGEGSHV